MTAGVSYSFYANTIGLYTDDVELTVYDSGGTQMAATTGFSDTAVISYTATNTGDLYLYVHNHSGYTGEFDLYATTLIGTDHFLTYNADTYTGAANERIFGDAGNDQITLGDGLDASGASGDDILIGNDLANHLSGGDGNDVIDTGNGDNVIWGGPGIDRISAGDDNDLIHGDDGADRIYAYGGNDRVYGGEGADLIFGGDGDDTIFGGSGNDRLSGEAGNDVIQGGDGADQLIGGNGIDTADYSDSTAGVAIDLTAGTGSGGTAAGDTLTTIENVTGSAYADALTGDANANLLDGGAGNDTLRGGAGADQLLGGAGNDALVGGAGADVMTGGTGNDTYYVDDPGDQTVESPGGGTDLVIAVRSWTLADNIENLTLAQGAGTNAIGNTLNNVITGNETPNWLAGMTGNDTLDGKAGDDILDGGAGTDTLTGGTGADTFRWTSTAHSPVGAGRDVITDFSLAEGDKIDLHYIDANTTVAGDQAFTFIGAANFNSVAGQLHFQGGILSGDVNGDGKADFEVQVTGVASPVAADFML